MKKQDKQEQKTNITILKTERNEYYKTFSLYHLYDKRLTMALRGFFDSLCALPNNWKITKRATSRFLGISERAFQNYVNDLKELGYIQVKKDKRNRAEYVLLERSIKIDFNPRLIHQYSLKQINYFLNSNTIKPRYKNLIKKVYKTAEKEEIEFTQTIKELEELEPTNNQNEENDIKSIDDELPF